MTNERSLGTSKKQCLYGNSRVLDSKVGTVMVELMLWTRSAVCLHPCSWPRFWGENFQLVYYFWWTVVCAVPFQKSIFLQFCTTDSANMMVARDFKCNVISWPIPVVTWVCGRLVVGISGSNPVRGMDFCLLWVFCVVKFKSLRRADHSSRGVLQSVVCLSVISKPRQERELSSLLLSSHEKKNVISIRCRIFPGFFKVYVLNASVVLVFSHPQPLSRWGRICCGFHGARRFVYRLCHFSVKGILCCLCCVLVCYEAVGLLMLMLSALWHWFYFRLFKLAGGFSLTL